MAEIPADHQKMFMLQKQTTHPSRQPLEVYHLSHDLRGPLNSILGFTELLVEGIEGPLNETQEADLAAIYQSAKNLLTLINTVVDLSKLEADRLILSSEEVDLKRAVENVLAAVGPADKPDRVELVVAMPDSLPPVRGDQERIEQIITSCIRFILKSRKEGRLTLTAAGSGQTVSIQISTDKALVMPEELPELFELTVRVDAAGRSELGRGGLTLPLAQKLAEKHGGRLWAEGAAEETTFYLELPVYA